MIPGILACAYPEEALASFRGALMYKTTATTHGSGLQNLIWEGEEYDTDDFHSQVTDIHKAVIPSGVSLVRVQAQTRTTANGPWTQIFKNAGVEFAGRSKVVSTLQGGWDQYNNVCTAPVTCTPGDFFYSTYNCSFGTSTPVGDTTWFAIEVLDPATKYALVAKSANQAISVINTNTTITWQTEIVDTDGWHDGANPERLTVVSGVDVVRVSLHLIDDNKAGMLLGDLHKNGAVFPGSVRKIRDTGWIEHISLVSPPLEVSAGDYFTGIAQMATVGNIVAEAATWMSIEEVPASYKRVLLKKTAAQAVAAGTGAAVIFEDEIYDTDGMHESVTNPSRVTVPGGVTEARLSFGLEWEAHSSSAVAWVTKNGAAYPNAYRGAPGDSSWNGMLGAIGAWVPVTPGEYFQLFTTSVGARNIAASNRTWFCMECR
jgi:hypothetical protein